jgi:hypothetical protein
MPSHARRPSSWVLAAAVTFVALAGCGGDDAQAQNAVAPQANVIAGKVTTADGKPIATPGVSINLSISGVATQSAEKVNFSPAVKPDGTYKQKVPEGSYRVNYGKITVPYGGDEFTFDLEPQGTEYKNNRDSSEGIVQDFVWRVTGPRLMYKDGKLNPNNHTHWNGMNLGMRYAPDREDLQKGADPVPEGTKLTFTLTPVAGKKAIDGSELKPVTFEREWRPKDITPNDDLNDFLPGEYTVTGVAKFPDGTTKPLVFQGKGDYPNYVPAGKVTLEKDGIIGGMWKQLFSFGIN